MVSWQIADAKGVEINGEHDYSLNLPDKTDLAHLEIVFLGTDVRH